MLRFQHDIKLLCNVLKVNVSTYYKHFSGIPAPRVKENQNIKRVILQIYSDYNKCLGAYKITYILCRDYGILISVGRVYRVMNSMSLPKLSTDKPRRGKHDVDFTRKAFKKAYKSSEVK